MTPIRSPKKTSSTQSSSNEQDKDAPKIILFPQARHLVTTFKDQIVYDNSIFEMASYYEFINCTFMGVTLSGALITECEFTNCTFIDCDFSFITFTLVNFSNIQFNGGCFGNITLCDCHFDKFIFSKCLDFGDIHFSGCTYSELTLYDLDITHVFFSQQLQHNLRKIHFENNRLLHCAFHWLDCEWVTFSNNSIHYCTFSNCKISPDTFKPSNITIDAQYNSIDFQTILQSNIPETILKQQFGIYSLDLKNYIMEMVNKLEFHTVFISYSFSDKSFAQFLNDALRKRGIITFLWEKDSPIGRRLNEIMSNNVAKYDKLLFIASNHSLKSEACHFELTNARKKQEKNWELVFFPIHIDNFLFTLEQYQIPIKYRSEFWKNIKELREINSMDFTAFVPKTNYTQEFDRQVDKLVKDLQKKN